MLQSVNVDNVDEPVVNIELTHFYKDELYRNTLLQPAIRNMRVKERKV